VPAVLAGVLWVSLGAALGLLLAIPAHAADAPELADKAAGARVALAPATGSVGIRAYGMGWLPIDGRFTRFDGSATYDPGNHAVCRVDLRIETASLELSAAAMRTTMLGPNFLDAARFPALRYSGVCGPGGLDGTLTMHGVARPFAMSLDWQAGAVVATGRLRRVEWGMTALPLLAGPTVRIEVSVHLPEPRRAAR
jgi:polyisoprenoid-binding protein YceI